MTAVTVASGDARVVASNVDTLIVNVKAEGLPEDLDAELEELKQASQDADADVPTPYAFDGIETLFIKAHGAGRQWRYILHCPSLHLDVGRGRLNGIVGKARLSAALLWECGPVVALAKLYDLLRALYRVPFELQVSEVHLCADVAGWDLTLDDARRFVSRSRRRILRLVAPDDEEGEGDNAEGWDRPGDVQARTDGRTCTGFAFSATAPHSCAIYDKTKELLVSRKDWMKPIWLEGGWDGAARVIRVEFRYERECLRELGVDGVLDLLDRLPDLWAYSTQRWLRHTDPDAADCNQTRWEPSPAWAAVQAAEAFHGGTPGTRQRAKKATLLLICQMLAGCSTTAAALLSKRGLLPEGEALPEADDGSHFLRWFYDWLGDYLAEKGTTFEGLRDEKRVRLGIRALHQAGNEHDNAA